MHGDSLEEVVLSTVWDGVWLVRLGDRLLYPQLSQTILGNF